MTQAQSSACNIIRFTKCIIELILTNYLNHAASGRLHLNGGKECRERFFPKSVVTVMEGIGVGAWNEMRKTARIAGIGEKINRINVMAIWSDKAV
ncbi:MAG: hypothetical protein RR244_03765 [Oscillospiraceae bacterium]